MREADTMNKIIHRFQLMLIYAIVFIPQASAQDTTLSKYGLWVIKEIATLQQQVVKNPDKAMIDLKKAIPALQLDLRYASKKNFTGERLYPKTRTSYLRKPAADSLGIVQNELKKSGLGLIIFDAYRPYSITEKLWEPVQDDRYAADPRKGSGHNRGIAVDVGIVNLQTGKLLDMGTGFDNFSDTAHHAFTDLPKNVIANRTLLKSIMEKHGFVALETEWWHYYLPNYRQFELLDIPFKHLRKIK